MPSNPFVKTTVKYFLHLQKLTKEMLAILNQFDRAEHFRLDESFDRFTEETQVTINNIESQNGPRPRRIHQRSTRLSNSVVMDTLGEGQFENEEELLKSGYLEVIDYVLNER